MNNNGPERGLFCTAQRLSILRERRNVRPFLSGERFWHERHAERLGRGAEEEDSPWENLDRHDLVRRLTHEGDLKRLAIVCAAGLGKSTNLRWLVKELAPPRTLQVPFFLELDDPDLPDSPRGFWHDTLPNQIRKAEENLDLPQERLLLLLRRARQRGRITLLLDSIDQASDRGRTLLRALLTSEDWRGCPIVVSARPHALFDGWDRLIVPGEEAWHFVRVEPLGEEERRRLLNQDGLDRYRLLPPGGAELMANPRNIEYVRKCPPKPGPERRREPDTLEEFTLRDLRTASHVFAGAVHHMVRYGMNNQRARRLGRPKDRTPPEQATPRQIAFALDLLGALAYTMYTLPSPVSRKDGDRTPPNVSHVPARQMPKFQGAVLKRLRAARVVQRSYDIADLEDDLDALAELNAEIKFDLLDTRPQRHDDFRWYDRSLQEFFAAWWLARHADDRDHDRLRSWRYDDPRDEAGRTLYQPLWGFLTEMPRAARRQRSWLQAVAVLFEPGVPRCCEMIFRAWPSLERSPGGRAILDGWQGEFRRLAAAPGPEGETARALLAGFRRCPPDPADDEKPFLMGSPQTEEDRRDDEFQHKVVLAPFLMHTFPVTNAQYELFDPAHKDERWGDKPHPAGLEAADHPVVMVTWFQAFCFARWTNNSLPTEAQWEYSCRGGPCSYQTFSCGNALDSSQANFDGKHPYGGGKKGVYRGTTTSVGSFAANAFGLHDMHGNVWEWCQDWYDGDFYRSKKGQRKDPRNALAAGARVLRGGGWYSSGGYCRSAFRRGYGPGFRYRLYGFRLSAVPALLEHSQSGSGA